MTSQRITNQCPYCKEYLAAIGNYVYCCYCGKALEPKNREEVIYMADVAKLKASLAKIKDRSSQEARAIRKQLRDAGHGLRSAKKVVKPTIKVAAKKVVKASDESSEV